MELERPSHDKRSDSPSLRDEEKLRGTDIVKEPLLEEKGVTRRNHLAKQWKESGNLTPFTSLALPWYRDRDAQRFLAMFFFTGGYMIVELAYGFKIGSLALIADALHMLSDLIALIIGFYALQASKRERTSQATFGYYRMEVVGGLINATFLVAICVTLVLDAIERFWQPEATDLTKNGLTLIIVATVGFGVNLAGVAIFAGGHGHGHGGHGHSHGGGGGEHGHGKHEDAEPREALSTTSPDVTVIHLGPPQVATTRRGSGSHLPGVGLKVEDFSKQKRKKYKNLNIYALLLHAAGDALGSLAVIFSGILIYFLKYEKRYYADPACTLFITALIFGSSIPLIKQTVAILLQKVPEHINLQQIQEQIEKVHGIYQIHDVHVWHLAQDKIVASLHALVSKSADFMKLADQVKNIFHSHGIHASTIQPEFVTDFTREDSLTGGGGGGGDFCHELVCEEEECHKKSCCPPTASKDAERSHQ